jgi:hypothetical protein
MMMSPEGAELEVKNVRSSNPCHLWRESLDVVLFSLEHFCGDKHGEIGILNVQLFYLGIEPPCTSE